MMPMILVVIAGVLEVVWATAMKSSQGFTRLWPSVLTIGAMIVSFALLAVAMRSLPLGVAYPVWVGIGAIGSALAGTALHAERLTTGQWLSIVLIAAGIVGLKALGKPTPAPPSIVEHIDR